jgi:hypothetical protein
MVIQTDINKKIFDINYSLDKINLSNIYRIIYISKYITIYMCNKIALSLELGSFAIWEIKGESRVVYANRNKSDTDCWILQDLEKSHSFRKLNGSGNREIQRCYLSNRRINDFWRANMQVTSVMILVVILYLKFTNIEDLRCSHQKIKRYLCEVIDMLVNMVVVVIAYRKIDKHLSI